MPRAPGKGHRGSLPFQPSILAVISTKHDPSGRKATETTQKYSVKFIHSHFNNVLVFEGILKIIRGLLTALGKEGVLHSFILST